MASNNSSSTPTTLFIELNKGDKLESSIFRLQKDWILRFTLGKGIYAQNVRLVIQPGNKEFIFPEPKKLSDYDIFVEFPCNQFGSFRYQFFLEDSKIASGNGYFHVIPEWNIGGGKQQLSLNSLSCITHLAKLLGPLNEWKSRLEVAHKAGYNCIHLTPIQVLGISNSSYSIADFQKVNPLFGSNVNFNDVQKIVDELENDWGMIFVQDVVWNHAARNSQWLQEHPECAFNCQNSPHLRPAYILDRALFHLSRDISEGKFADRGLPDVIDNDGHLGALAHILRSDILPSLRLHEFFQIGADNVIEELRHSLGQGSFHTSEDGASKIEHVQDLQFRRFGSSINIESAKRWFLSKITYNRGNLAEEDNLYEEIRQEIGRINEGIKNNFQGTIDAIVNAVMGHVGYERVAGHGRRLGKVTEIAPLMTNYFLYPFETTTVEEDEKHAYDPEKGKYIMACNGWVMGDDPMNNFAVYPSQVNISFVIYPSKNRF
jgi:glycogen debranching enzyme